MPLLINRKLNHVFQRTVSTSHSRRIVKPAALKCESKRKCLDNLWRLKSFLCLYVNLWTKVHHVWTLVRGKWSHTHPYTSSPALIYSIQYAYTYRTSSFLYIKCRQAFQNSRFPKYLTITEAFKYVSLSDCRTFLRWEVFWASSWLALLWLVMSLSLSALPYNGWAVRHTHCCHGNGVTTDH